ncbi:hypothetical protein ACU8DI_01265 [Psychroserpens sp. BH13MA-6]
MKRFLFGIISFSCLAFFVTTCDKYESEDLVVLEELSVLAQEYYNNDLSKDAIISHYEQKGYKCYFTNDYDEYYINNFLIETSLVYEKSKNWYYDMTLRQTVSVSEISKIYEVSISIDTTKNINAKIRTSTTLVGIKLFDMKKYDMSKYDSVYDIGR